ncbi:hypothetical protein ACROYT_G006871 [Oculina patagonica]
MQLGIKEETVFNDDEMANEEVIEADLSPNDEDAVPYRRGLAPGYYKQECNAHKPCPSGKYCHFFLCVKCLGENVPCNDKGQCCRGQCTYGRCKRSSVPGEPGTFCNRKRDCRGDSCCVRDTAVNLHKSICKPPLGENMVCGPINFFKNVYVGDEVCGPCKPGLVCKQVGIFGVHEICVRA